MKGWNTGGPVDALPIAFLHGGVINRRMWDPVVDSLLPDYRCMAIDLPAHGDLMERGFTVEKAVAWVGQVFEETGVERALLVGMSLGGYIAQAFATQHPEQVEGLVLSGATIRYTGWDGLSTRMYGLLFPLLSRPAMKAFASKMRDDLGEEVAGPVLAAGLSVKGGSQALRRLPGRDYAAGLAGLDLPVALVNGRRDTDNLEAEPLFREHVPRAATFVIEDAGHACAIQKPDAFASVVRKFTQSLQAQIT